MKYNQNCLWTQNLTNPYKLTAVPEKRVHDQDENAKVREKVRKKLQQLQQQQK